MDAVAAKYEAARKEVYRLEHTGTAPSPELDKLLEEKGETAVKDGARLADLIRRPRLTYEDLAPFDPERPALSAEVVREAEISLKYAGYIDRQQDEIARLRASENTRLPADIDYATISGLSKEITHKLSQARPETLGQASRIPGVTPAAISLLLIHLKKRGAGQSLEQIA
jgi:tRNA uridine 5-carboxymethylaminomethyl modification enzyme